MDSMQMKNGQMVEVKLSGDESWYDGVVINAKKSWVQLNPYKYPAGDFIADEGNIVDWRMIELTL